MAMSPIKWIQDAWNEMTTKQTRAFMAIAGMAAFIFTLFLLGPVGMPFLAALAIGAVAFGTLLVGATVARKLYKDPPKHPNYISAGLTALTVVILAILFATNAIPMLFAVSVGGIPALFLFGLSTVVIGMFYFMPQFISTASDVFKFTNEEKAAVAAIVLTTCIVLVAFFPTFAPFLGLLMAGGVVGIASAAAILISISAVVIGLLGLLKTIGVGIDTGIVESKVKEMVDAGLVPNTEKDIAQMTQTLKSLLGRGGLTEELLGSMASRNVKNMVDQYGKNLPNSASAAQKVTPYTPIPQEKTAIDSILLAKAKEISSAYCAEYNITTKQDIDSIIAGVYASLTNKIGSGELMIETVKAATPTQLFTKQEMSGIENTDNDSAVLPTIIPSTTVSSTSSTIASSTSTSTTTPTTVPTTPTTTSLLSDDDEEEEKYDYDRKLSSYHKRLRERLAESEDSTTATSRRRKTKTPTEKTPKQETKEEKHKKDESRSGTYFSLTSPSSHSTLTAKLKKEDLVQDDERNTKATGYMTISNTNSEANSEYSLIDNEFDYFDDNDNEDTDKRVKSKEEERTPSTVYAHVPRSFTSKKSVTSESSRIAPPPEDEDVDEDKGLTTFNNQV